MSDSKRVYNFNPGPAALPYEVLQQAQARNDWITKAPVCR